MPGSILPSVIAAVAAGVAMRCILHVRDRRILAARTRTLGRNDLMTLLITWWDLAAAPSRRAKQIDAVSEQWIDLLNALISGLKAGCNMAGALAGSPVFLEDPLAGEVKRACADMDVGMSTSAALEALAGRLGLQEARSLALAATIAERSGGDLPSALISLREAARSRSMLRKKLRVLTASSRYSAYVLVLTPLVFLGLMPVLTGHGPLQLLAVPQVWIVLAAGGVLDAAGFIVMRRMAGSVRL